MSRRRRHPFSRFLERFSGAATAWTGGSLAFGIAVSIILLWAATGPLFSFSNTWQLAVNTLTTIVTFLMVFLIQRAQNKDNEAIQLKLNEIVAALDGASNRLIDVEALSEDHLHALHGHYHELARLAREDASMTRSHTIEEARARHAGKHGGRRRGS